VRDRTPFNDRTKKALNNIFLICILYCPSSSMSDNEVTCLEEKENVLKEKKIRESKTNNNNVITVLDDEKKEKETLKKGT